ncbi:helix-turn-helix domain-containing protein [Streptomyces violascens]|uniref:helix-turn-helix domain-containing protein n=1 Tax=Streptomyces violascens TaxID=67381 RepID=UPI001673B3D8|nr:helix-turn-helix transcriptional regulator [Streptomyces violascens]GGU40561.1 hypothetical protein GCM10010289_71790 [Streptomyces violascens]
MTSEWNKHERLAMLRTADTVTALLSVPAGRGAAGRLVLERLLAGAFEILVEGDLEEEGEYAEAAVCTLSDADTASEEAARGWLERALRRRAREHNEDLFVGERGWVDPVEHDVWALLALGPLARRIRLWSTTLRKSGPELGSSIGCPAHQLRHWASGNSLPTAEHRIALAHALGVHPAWLHAERDHSADTDLYLYDGRCPCGATAGFTQGPVDTGGLHEDEEAGQAAWCNACGQPLLQADGKTLLALPLMGTDSPLNHQQSSLQDFWAAYVRDGRDLSEPWPHGLWCPGDTPRQRGPVRVPGPLTVPPRTPPPQPAAPTPARVPAPRRRAGRPGVVPQSGVERTGVEKIEAFVRWVGGGRKLTGKGHIKLADARMLTEALDTGDVWDQVEHGFQYKTRSSAELSHLTRIITWTTAAGILHADGGMLLPVSDSLRLADDPVALCKALADALVDVALTVLWWPTVLSPLSERPELEHALAVIRQHLAAADGPVAVSTVGEAVWNVIGKDKYGQDEFEDPEGAERAVLRDLPSVLRLCQDVGLVRLHEGDPVLTQFGRSWRWAYA